MTSKLPFLFLDIDGVLQAPYMKNGHERTRRITIRRPGVAGNYRVRVSPVLFEALEQLTVEVRWLTYWCDQEAVRDFLEQVPGPVFPHSAIAPFPKGEAVLGYGAGTPTGAWVNPDWKRDYVRDTLRADPRPFIWADDDEVPVHGTSIAADFGHLPHLLVAPDSNFGLTLEHVARMSHLLAGIAEGAA